MDRIAADTERECADIAARARQNANLAARKNTLAAKRELLNTAFDKALDQLCSLSGDEYARLVGELVCASAETGREAVLVPAAHRVRFEKPFVGGKTMIEILNAAYKEKRGTAGNFSIAGGGADFSGGVKLIGERADYDCSFDTLVAEWRESNEARVYEMLFKKEG